MSGTLPAEDIRLLERLREGRKEALLELYKSNQAMVKQYILRNQGSLEDAEDLLQEALVVLWQNVHKAEFALTARISTYLMAVVKNKWLKNLSKNGRIVGEELMPMEAVTAPSYGQSNGMDMKIISDSLDQLGDTCRELLIYFYYDGLDMINIAKLMKFANSDTAKAKKYQCFKKLEELVKKKYKLSDFTD